MIAAGMYLWTLRELRRQSRGEVASYIREITGEGTNDVQVMRIEKGQDTKAVVLAAFTTFVQGDPTTVNDLLASRDATPEAAKALARAWFDHGDANVKTQMSSIMQRSSDERQEIAEILHRLASLIEADHSPQDALRIVTAERELQKRNGEQP